MGMAQKMIDRFNTADLNDRMELVNQHGEFLLYREYYNRRWALYALDGFHAEVIYNPETNMIERVQVADNLDKYAPFIQLNF